MRIYPIKLRNKIFLLCTALVLVTTLVIQVSTWWSTHQFNQRQISSQVVHAKQILIEYLAAREKLLATAANVLTSDFGFIRAVATLDTETIHSVLVNHGARIDADLMLLVTLSGQVITSSQKKIDDGSLSPNITQVLTEHPGKSFFSTIDGDLYQLILLPIRAPHNIAYNIIGFKIDNADVAELKKLTGVDISFYERDEHLLSSTVRLTSFSQFRDQLIRQHSHWFLIPRPAFITEELSLPSADDSFVGVLLTNSLAPLYKQYDQIGLHNLALASIVAIIASLLSIFFAKSLTVPLTKLTQLAEKYARGDYDFHIDLDRSGTEIRRLLNAFETMGRTIKTREDRILYQAEHDILTGLLNIYTVKEKLPNILENKVEKLLIRFSIKNFRQINDRLGHEIADKCLIELASRLRELQVFKVELAARMDGVEFFAVIEKSKHLKIISQVGTFLDILEREMTISELVLHLDINAGVVQYPDDGHKTVSLLRRTSIALDNARKNKQRIHLYETGEDEQHLERLAIIDALKKVLKNPSQTELFMVYQPKLELSSNTIRAESLIRWMHPDKGFISPELFVSLAEQAGLIVELTHWVIESVLKDMQRWKKSGAVVPVAINVSAQDLTNTEFEKELIHLTHVYKVNPSSITLEITERDIMHNEKQIIEALMSLKSRGFRIAIDDYGIGQSSLSKLKDLPVNEIKLDKSFIMTIDSSVKDKLIVRSTIELAHDLGFYVVAEGVENKSGMDILHDLHCDQVQGYFISKPLPYAEFDVWREKYVQKDSN